MRLRYRCKDAFKHTPVEDFNAQVWTNPSLAQVSYEPFNPLGSPTPDVEEIVTPSPTPTGSPESTVSINPLATELPDDASTSSFPTGIVVLVIIAVLGAGGYSTTICTGKTSEAQRVAKRKIQGVNKPAQAPMRHQDPERLQGRYPLAQDSLQDRLRPAQAHGERRNIPQGSPGTQQGTAQYRPPAGLPPSGTPQGCSVNHLGQPPQSGTPQGTAQYRPPTGQPPQAGATGTAQYRPPTGQAPLAVRHRHCSIWTP